MTGSGRIFAACNVENISFGLTICAERAAVVSAVAGGETDLVALAVVAETDIPIVPCGACRQFLAEFSPKLKIFAEGSHHAPLERNLAELLPLPSAGILNRG
jgi:cytidine deaminase